MTKIQSINININCVLQYFLAYGPDYQLDIPPGRRHDMNTTEDLKNLLNTVSGTLKTMNPQIINASIASEG